jgi:hypothetical protein
MENWIMTPPLPHQLTISDAGGEIFRLDLDGTVTADIDRIRAAANQPSSDDYVILCRALVWALDRASGCSPLTSEDSVHSARHAAYQALAVLARHVPPEQRAEAEARTQAFLTVFDALAANRSFT